MGYQVGNHCYATKAEAENVYFSLIAPLIQNQTQNQTVSRPFPYPSTTSQVNKAVIIAPEYRNNAWYLNGQIIHANLPVCDPVQNFKDGLELGWLVFAVMASCYVFVVLKGLLR